MDARMIQSVHASPQCDSMLRESHRQIEIAQGLLQDAQISVLLDRLWSIETKCALGDNNTLSDHAGCLLDVGVALPSNGVNVLDQQLFELLLVLWGKICPVLDGRLGKLVRLDFARQCSRQLMVDWKLHGG